VFAKALAAPACSQRGAQRADVGQGSVGVEPRRLSQPEPLEAHHDLSQFECGKPTLDHRLRSHAMANEGTSSRTFVVCDDGATVVARLVRSQPAAWPERKCRGASASSPPNPVPIMVLGRLAVDKRCQGLELRQCPAARSHAAHAPRVGTGRRPGACCPCDR
jgi:hypothetical protein